MLVDCYHSLIDLEGSKYESSREICAVHFTWDEAVERLSPLVGDRKQVERILRELSTRGFLVLLGGGEGKRLYRTLHMDLTCRMANIRIQYESLRYPLESRLMIKDEWIPHFREHSIDELKKVVKGEIFPPLRFALEKSGITGLSDFQWRALLAILKGNERAVLLPAPTSGGKTLAFVLPALIRILSAKAESPGDRRIRVIFIYPRKSLERDQLSKLIRILYYLNFHLKNLSNMGFEVTVGVDDRETPSVKSRWKAVQSGESFRGMICPACGGELEYQRLGGGRSGYAVRCGSCGERFPWIHADREGVWGGKPDILITNVWALDWRLPSRTVQYDYSVFRGIEMVVLDEAHVYQSLLGGNVRYLIKRLELSAGREPKIILSSATMPRPEEFAGKLLDLRPEDMALVRPVQGRGRRKKVIYLVLGIHPRRSWETAVYEILLLLSSVYLYRKVQSVVFIDSIKELNRIYGFLEVAARNYGEPKDHFDRQIVPDPLDPYAFWHLDCGVGFDDATPLRLLDLVKIHHSRIPDRHLIERLFSSGELGVLMSTSSLELGVDYPNVGIVVMVGVPFKLESIPQRIGRAGRNAEKTLNTTLAVIVLRNTPLEMYYIFRPDELIRGFERLEIPVAWRNVAVKKYHALSVVVDELARLGENTFVLGTDGSNFNLKDFAKAIVSAGRRPEVVKAVAHLDPKTCADEPTPSRLLGEALIDISYLPARSEDMERIRRDFSSFWEMVTEVEENLLEARSLMRELPATPELRELLLKLEEAIRTLRTDVMRRGS